MCALESRTMYTVSVTNQKGGVGKTATTINIGAAWAKHLAKVGAPPRPMSTVRLLGRVLLIDLDPQGHLTRHLGVPMAPNDRTLKRALTGEWRGDSAELVTPYDDHLHVIPTNLDMFLADGALYPIAGREFQLTRVLEPLRDRYDVCLIDTPPNLGPLTDNALLAARRMLVPIQSEDSSLDALELLDAQVSTLCSAFNIEIEHLGFVVNGHDVRHGEIATSTLNAMMAAFGPQILQVVKDRKEIRAVKRLSAPVAHHAPDSEAAGWYRSIVAALEPRRTKEVTA